MKNEFSGVGVTVGRFQTPFLHEGHKEILRNVNSHEKGIVFIGCAATPLTKPNPLDFITRKMMVQEIVGNHVTIMPINDHPSDEVWSNNLDAMIRNVVPFGKVTLYHSRDSFHNRYHGKFDNKEIETVGNFNATELRAEAGGIALDTPDFRAGVIYASQNMYPRVQPTVDVIIYDYPNQNEPVRLLMGRKPGRKTMCFVGGFIDMGDLTAEDAALRELKEETGLITTHQHLEWVGCHKINDWRDTPSTSVMTTCFKVDFKHCLGNPIADDDIEELKWMDTKDPSLIDVIGPSHHVLYKAFMNKW